MRRRACAILMTVWTVLVLPVLCDARLIEHGCECPTQSCAPESDCASDPCTQDLVIRLSRSDQDGADLATQDEFRMPPAEVPAAIVPPSAPLRVMRPADEYEPTAPPLPISTPLLI